MTTSLSTETPPRSAATIEQLTASVTGQSRSFTRVGFWFCVGFVVFIGAVTSIAQSQSVDTNSDWHDVAGVIGVLAALMALGAYTVRALVRRDERMAPILVRDGAAFAGQVTQRARRGNGMYVLRVAWLEEGRECSARFDIAKNELAVQRDVTVLALPREPWVGVVIGESEMFLGKRAIW